MKLSFLLTFSLMTIAFASPELADIDSIDFLKDGIGGRGYEEQLRNLMEKVRAMMEVGSESLGIPILAPYKKDSLEININSPPTASVGLNITDLLVEGLNLFEVTNINFNMLPPTLDFNINMPKINISAPKYNLDGNVMDTFKLFGNGSVGIEIEDFSFKGNTRVVPANGFLEMRTFNIELNIRELKCDIKGLLGGGEISNVINEVLGKFIPSALIQQKVAISEFIGNYVKNFANPYLSKITLNDVIDMIQGNKP